MKHLIPLMFLTLTSAANAEVSASDVATALETRYGPLDPNTSLSVSVNSVGPYNGRQAEQESGLPDNFVTVVWDKESKRFAALVKDKAGNPIRIAGKADLERKIPTLKSRLEVGDIISRSDIEYINIPSNNSLNSILSSDSDIIGKEIVRPISPGRPIPADNIANPTVIKRNEEVQIIYKKGGLHLISKGKSLSNASVGDTVKVFRKDAARTLEGTAVSVGVVEINSGAAN